MAVINGVDVDKWNKEKNDIIKDPAVAERKNVVNAKWEGGDLSEVEAGGMTIKVGGRQNMRPMQVMLASLAACEIDLISAHAAKAGIKMDALTVEATGFFNRAAYFGIEGAPGAGYNKIEYTVNIKAPGITQQQITQLEEACKQFSPVGDSLSKKIPISFKIKAE